MPEAAESVRITRVEPGDAECLAGLAVRAGQAAWVGPIAATLAGIARSRGSESMAIWHGRHAIGHYRLDPNPCSITGRELAVPTLGLRAFFIDARWQGRGLGTAALAALIADGGARHPAARQVAAGVDADNHAALHLYLRGGFRVDGELYRDGRGVAQLLLLHALP